MIDVTILKISQLKEELRAALKEITVLKGHLAVLEVERGSLLNETRFLQQHREGYDGPCACRTCQEIAQ